MMVPSIPCARPADMHSCTHIEARDGSSSTAFRLAAGPLLSLGTLGTVAARQVVMLHTVQWRHFCLELHGPL